MTFWTAGDFNGPTPQNPNIVLITSKPEHLELLSMAAKLRGVVAIPNRKRDKGLAIGETNTGDVIMMGGSGDAVVPALEIARLVRHLT